MGRLLGHANSVLINTHKPNTKYDSDIHFSTLEQKEHNSLDQLAAQLQPIAHDDLSTDFRSGQSMSNQTRPRRDDPPQRLFQIQRVENS